MAKGAVAKTNVVKILQQAFGENYIGESDKKYYVWADDGGERVQIAISLTCPKIYLESAVAAEPISQSDSIDFEAAPPANNEDIPFEFSEEENKRLEDLMKKLGLL